MTKEEQLEHLNHLIAVAKDSELGYRTAAEHVDDSHLATIFADYAKQRAGFVEALAGEATRLLGDAPSENGTVMGSVFRGWMDVKSALTGGSPSAIVAACETGEDSAEAAYEKVVNLDVSGKMRSLVESQWNKIKEAHHRLLNLKAQFAGDHEKPIDAVDPSSPVSTSHSKSH
jgi:uncharacterized protein (TIGR02284 family)